MAPRRRLREHRTAAVIGAVAILGGLALFIRHRARYTERPHIHRDIGLDGPLPVSKAVIFDIDGTLVDSVDLHAKAWQEAFHDFGHDIEFANIRRQIGKGGDQLMPIFMSKDELADRGEALEKHRSALFKKRYLPHVVAFPHVRALLQKLRGDGKRIILASSAKESEIAIYKKIAGITDLVEIEVSADDVEKSKPHGDIFASAMSKLPGLAPADIIVVGDTPYDAEAAAKVGLKTIGVLCGGFSEDSLCEAGCVAIYKDPKHMLDNYERWAQPALIVTGSE
jgi:HAD superfamily hydrolase (TIGR01509 family)